MYNQFSLALLPVHKGKQLVEDASHFNVWHLEAIKYVSETLKHLFYLQTWSYSLVNLGIVDWAPWVAAILQLSHQYWKMGESTCSSSRLGRGMNKQMQIRLILCVELLLICIWYINNGVCVNADINCKNECPCRESVGGNVHVTDLHTSHVMFNCRCGCHL